MHRAQHIADDASRLVRAGQVLRGQLDAVVRLGVLALRMIEEVARVAQGAGGQVRSFADPVAGAVSIDRAARRYARIAWALRLIDALRSKLLGDLGRVERGERVGVERRPAPAPQDLADKIAAQMARLEAEVEADRQGRRERPETERGDCEIFGRYLAPYLSGRSGSDEFSEILKKPTEEILAMIREALGVSEDAEREGKGEPPAAPFPLDGRRARDGGGALSSRPPDS